MNPFYGTLLRDEAEEKNNQWLDMPRQKTLYCEGQAHKFWPGAHQTAPGLLGADRKQICSLCKHRIKAVAA